MAAENGVDDFIDTQTYKEMKVFEPLPNIKNIMVTGGNGFMCVLNQSSTLSGSRH